MVLYRPYRRLFDLNMPMADFIRSRVIQSMSALSTWSKRLVFELSYMVGCIFSPDGKWVCRRRSKVGFPGSVNDLSGFSSASNVALMWLLFALS